jgi:hypothetical protein
MDFYFNIGDRVKVDPVCAFTNTRFSFDYRSKKELRGQECIIKNIDLNEKKVIIADFFFDPRDLELIEGPSDKKYEVAPITLDIEKLDCEVICPFTNMNASNAK